MVLIVVASVALANEPPTNHWMMATDFPGGSAEVLLLDAEAGVVRIQPALHPGRGWPCWWYFRLEGLTVGREVTLEVVAHPQPFRGETRLAPNWCQPTRAALSSDNVTWQQTPPHVITPDKVAVYRFPAPAATIWLAWGPPFVPADAEALLARIAAERPEAQRFELARTRQGRAVPGIQIGGGSGDAPARFGVWVQARQHAWESGSSWVGRGFIEWAASADPAAVELRRIATIYFVPIMDVDNVTLGAGGKEAEPRDHNRDWDDSPVYPEVAAAQQRIGELIQQQRLQIYLDLHNPGAGERRPYFFGPLDLETMPLAQRRLYDRWAVLGTQFICDPLPLDPHYHFATYVKTEEERRRVSGAWVRERAGERAVAVTLETVWNTPHGTTAGYQAVGRQLAQATASYLAEAPFAAAATAN